MTRNLLGNQWKCLRWKRYEEPSWEPWKCLTWECYEEPSWEPMEMLKEDDPVLLPNMQKTKDEQVEQSSGNGLNLM